MKKPPLTAYAFIDAQNMYKALEREGWRVCFKSFRRYLKEKHNVEKALVFYGYVKEHEKMYDYLRRAGFEVVLQDATTLPSGNIKGNVDVNLTIHALMNIAKYQKAVLISADGDFQPLVLLLNKQAKHTLVISPAPKADTSRLLRSAAAGNFVYMEDIRDKICQD